LCSPVEQDTFVTICYQKSTIHVFLYPRFVYCTQSLRTQLLIDGELIGGCDIIIDMYQQGELQKMIIETAKKYRTLL
ncbi:MAG: hypothetical protein ACTS89_00875, partial [Arsenophonus sp. ER-LPS3-MAG3]